MAYKKYAIIGMSSLMLAGATWCPAYLWWCIFFYAPLFLMSASSALDGVLWTITFFVLHALPIFYSFLLRAASVWLGLLLVLAICLWIVLIAAVSFVPLWCGRKFLAPSSPYVIGLRACCLWLVAMCIEYAFFLPCGLWCGYPLCFPLLPMAGCARVVLCALPCLGQGLLLSCLLASAFFAVRAVRSWRLWCAICAGLFLSPFFVGFVCRSNYPVPAYVYQCCCAPIDTLVATDPFERAQEISWLLLRCVQLPNVRLILMPESTYPHPLNTFHGLADAWSRTLASGEGTLVIGTHRVYKGALYNVMAIVAADRPCRYYHKKTCMPFVEYVPSSWPCVWLKKIFLQSGVPFVCDGTERRVLKLLEDLCVEPYLCAEFFLAHTPALSGVPILCLAYDGWFYGSMAARLMLAHARYKAAWWRRDVVYVTRSGGYYCGPSGKCVRLRGVQ